MTKFLYALIFAFPLLAMADAESYQVENAIGLWKGVDPRYDLLVTPNTNKNNLLMRFCAPEIETRGICTEVFNFSAIGTFEASRGDISFVHEENDYYVIEYFKVDPMNPNQMTRAFGRDGFLFSRLK